MPTAIVTQSSGRIVQVRLVSADTTETTTPAEAVALAAASTGEAEATAETAVAKTAPNPIAATPNELAWAAGSFLVLFVVLRYFLFPKLKKGMDARYADIRSDIEGAGQVKADAQNDVAAYDKQIAAVRVEAAGRLDAARQTVDTERTAKLAEVNARIATARADAEAKTAAARSAAQGQIATAVAQVATKAATLASGQTPDASVVQAAVAAAMESAGSR
jgi:F-type H+-transporting ATPase subunit b